MEPAPGVTSQETPAAAAVSNLSFPDPARSVRMPTAATKGSPENEGRKLAKPPESEASSFEGKRTPFAACTSVNPASLRYPRTRSANPRMLLWFLHASTAFVKNMRLEKLTITIPFGRRTLRTSRKSSTGRCMYCMDTVMRTASMDSSANSPSVGSLLKFCVNLAVALWFAINSNRFMPCTVSDPYSISDGKWESCCEQRSNTSESGRIKILNNCVNCCRKPSSVW
mmetsp:Transcript_141406/g.368250  ORF Transcript_141406/g.368250 Transcript_141406/m.368250 type:complete len:226 (-) Transcript_141406:321-998(-)